MLPAPVAELRQQGGPGRPWFLRYGDRSAVLRKSDGERLRLLGLTPPIAVRSTVWLHEFLGDLASVGFLAPTPVADLKGSTFSVTRGDIWELLTFVPGEPMSWSVGELDAAGRLLARYHLASLQTPAREQRPGALPIVSSVPAHVEAREIRSLVEVELRELDYAGLPHGVIHGDATQSNVVVDHGDHHLVDFALSYREALIFDIGSALWRNGRVSPDAVAYEPSRVAPFVRGYCESRALTVREARAIVTCMLGRGLQLQRRLELRHGEDPTVMSRLMAIYGQRSDLERAALDAAGS
jgi:Ser/Thr protein kinase RdoA (MazF antagonist)